MKNFLTVTLLSLGVPMILMGDEVRRTQRGNNNAYWHGQRDELVRLVAGRQACRCASVRDAAQRARLLRDMEHERRRVTSDTVDPSRRIRHGTESSSINRIGAYIRIAIAVTVEFGKQGSWPTFILNAYWEPLEFELPPVHGGETQWRRWIDTALDSPHDIVRGKRPRRFLVHPIGPRRVRVVVLFARVEPGKSL